MTKVYDPVTKLFKDAPTGGEVVQTPQTAVTAGTVPAVGLAPVPLTPPVEEMLLEQILEMCKYEPNLPPHGNSAWLVATDSDTAAKVAAALSARFVSLLNDEPLEAQESNILVQGELLTKLEHSHSAVLVLSSKAELIAKSIEAKNGWDKNNEKLAREFDHKEAEQVKQRPAKPVEHEVSLREAIVKGKFAVEFAKDEVKISIPDETDIPKYGQALLDMGFAVKLTPDSMVDYDKESPAITLQGDAVARTLENFSVFESAREKDLAGLAQQKGQVQGASPSI